MPNLSRMRVLVDEINRHNIAYYVNDSPTISDAEWDALYNELLELESETGAILPDSPTRRVGGEPLKKFEQHSHLARLWSLDKAQNIDELRAWAKRAEKLRPEEFPQFEYVVEHKFDGLTLNLTYDGGELTNAATRGNGLIGEVILPQVRTIRSVPLSIPFKGRMEVQGEGIMRLSVFDLYNRTAKDPLKNPRNGAAGALRNLDPAITAARRLDAFFYNIGYIEGKEFARHSDMVDFLRENSIPVSERRIYCKSLSEVEKAVSNIEVERSSLDYLIDGAVVKIDDFRTREAMGYTDKFPRWAVAVKFEAQEATTTLNAVTWELGRTGKLTPLAHLEPVELGGALIAKATLNNWDDIQRKNVAIGCRVFVRRSNDVIPEIMGRAEDDSYEIIPIQRPLTCPECRSELVERGAHIFCQNRDCEPQIAARLTHFASRDAMDIEGFSEKTALLFHKELGIAFPSDLYALTKERLSGLPGFAEKKAENLINSLERSKRPTLSRFIFAIGIPNVGKKTAGDLAENFGSVDALACASIEALISISDVGDIVAGSIIDFFADDITKSEVDRLLSSGVQPIEVPSTPDPTQGGTFSGELIVLTGALTALTRIEAAEKIAELGGKTADSVTKKTTLIVAGENAGSKLVKAQSLGIPVISEAEFLERLRGGS